jgi:plastocyanin
MVSPRCLLALASLCAVALAGCSGGGDEGRSDEPTPSPSASDGLSASASGTAAASSSATSSSSGSGSSAAPPPPRTIAKDVADNSFPDGTFTIRAGDTVVWTHRGGLTTPHSVTSAGHFDSHPDCPPVCMLAGQTYSHTFDAPGTFGYVCKVHGSMTGTITVTAT